MTGADAPVTTGSGFVAKEPPPDALLVALDVSKSFGGLHAVSDVTFWIPERGIVSIIGPNGAGKTTFFNMLTGLYRPTSGRIVYRGPDKTRKTRFSRFLDKLGLSRGRSEGATERGRDITSMRPDRIMELGIARTFQNIRLFGTMTALENVLVGEHARMSAGLIGSIVRSPKVRGEEKAVYAKAQEVLEYVGLPPRVYGERAVNLSYGDQRRVEIARALASDPSLLLLDEPTAGMNADESARLVAFVRQLRDERGVTILLIEHDMRVVMELSERVTVFDHGETIAEGDPHSVAADPRVVEAYLGKQGESK